MINQLHWEAGPVSNSKWVLLFPRVAFVLFVAAVSALLWFSHRQEVADQRATLISDMLWLEQNLHFQLARNEELLGQSLRPSNRTTQSFAANAQALLANNTGLRQVFLVDSHTHKLVAHPNDSNAHLVGEAQGAVPSRSVVRLVQSLGKPAYSAPYPVLDNDWQIEVHVPVFMDGKTVAIAIGVYSMRRLIDETVPWWLAERYRIAVTDSGGKELIARSKVVPVVANAGYSLSFDPPGYGLLLSATPYQAPFRLIDRLLIFVTIGLAFATLFSFFLVRTHLQQRLRAEGALRKEYRFRQAMERSVQTGLRARDLTGRVLYVNEAFCRMVGWDEADLVGRTPPMPYWPEDGLEEIRDVHDRILAGDGPTEGFELTFRRRSGETFVALIHEAPLIDESGVQIGWMGSVVDISDRKAAEEETLRQQERMQATARLVALGEMGSGLAHELNQPLAAISGYCSGALRILRDQKPHSDVIPALEKAVEQTQRAGNIIRRIYALAKREGGSTEQLVLADSLRSALLLIDSFLKRQGIRVVEHIEDDGLRITGDTVLIEQTVFNLLRNAADAMTNVAPEQRVMKIGLSAQDGYAQLDIADQGPGIPPSLETKIFDPLFSTKQEGMGMGLAICRSVVESHKGRLWFDTNPVGGTIFHVRLPLAQS